MPSDVLVFHPQHANLTDLRMVQRAVRNGWEMTPERKRAIVDSLKERLKNDPRPRLDAAIREFLAELGEPAD